MNRYYNETFSYAETDLTKNRLKKRAEETINKMLKINKKGRRFLDIGAGYGYFLQEVARHKGKAIGIEPSKKLYMQLQNKANVYNGTVENFLKSTQTKFDFINLSHVIEHVNEPIALLMGLKAMLNEKGVLYIETPNANSWLAKFERNKYVFLTPPDHINIFSISELIKLCSRLGFNIKHVKTYDYPEHVIGSLRQIKKVVIPDLIRDPGNTKRTTSTTNTLQQSRSIGNHINQFLGTILARILSPLFQINHKGAISCLYITKY